MFRIGRRVSAIVLGFRHARAEKTSWPITGRSRRSFAAERLVQVAGQHVVELGPDHRLVQRQPAGR